MTTKFEDLCELATKWQADGTHSWIQLHRAVFVLTQRFASYIEAPATFADPKTGNAVRYVEAMGHGTKEDGTNIPVPVDSYMDALDMDDPDGYGRFSIGTALESAPSVYPKIRFGVFLKMKMIGKTIEVRLLNKTYIPFTIDLAKPETFEKLFEAMVDLLESNLKMRNNEASRLPSIGFALTAATPAQKE
jgi:hypothetical protein